jgi:hypothetical protein
MKHIAALVSHLLCQASFSVSSHAGLVSMYDIIIIIIVIVIIIIIIIILIIIILIRIIVTVTPFCFIGIGSLLQTTWLSMFRIAIRRPICTSLDFHAAIVTRFANCHFPDCHIVKLSGTHTCFFHVESHVIARCQLQVLVASFSALVTVTLNARLNCRSGGSVDPFWPSVARKTQAVVDAVMQVCRPTRILIRMYIYILICCYFDLNPWAAPFEFTPLLLVTSS